MQTVEQLIETLKLERLQEEGGYFRRVYQSEEADAAGRRYAASILYLLAAPDFSCFHRIDCDEIWHFYAGDPLLLHQIDAAGQLTQTYLGNPLKKSNAAPFTVISKNNWFAAEVTTTTGFSLVGCTTVPEFLFKTFEVAKANELCAAFPKHANLIHKLTR